MGAATAPPAIHLDIKVTPWERERARRAHSGHYQSAIAPARGRSPGADPLGSAERGGRRRIDGQPRRRRAVHREGRSRSASRTPPVCGDSSSQTRTQQAGAPGRRTDRGVSAQSPWQATTCTRGTRPGSGLETITTGPAAHPAGARTAAPQTPDSTGARRAPRRCADRGQGAGTQCGAGPRSGTRADPEGGPARAVRREGGADVLSRG